LSSVRIILSSLVLSLAVPFGGTAAMGAEPSASSGTEATAPHVWLNGPFGTVLGADPAAPAGAAPAGAPLDTWIRGAPLLLGTELASGDALDVSVVSTPLDGHGRPEQLSVGDTEFSGPDTTGLNVITATVRTDPYGTSEHAWLVVVPDRESDPGLLFDIPGPRVRLLSDAGSVDGEQGHGCYVYMCREVGYRPPETALDALPMGAGETPSIEIDDGSAMVGWKGTLEPLHDTLIEPILAEETFADAPRVTTKLTGREPTVAGEWLLERLVEYDRDGGWQWFLYRLIAE